jgi:hypothetical protein
MAVFDPLSLIPSSSAGEVDFELPHAGFSPVSALKVGTSFPRNSHLGDATRQGDAAPHTPPAPQVYPRSVDISVVSARGKAPAIPVPSPFEDEGAGGSRSPPHCASPPPPLEPLVEEELPSDDADDTEPDETELVDPSEPFESELHNSEVEVESSAGSDLEDWEDRVHFLEVWLPRGSPEVVARLAFAYVSPAEVCANVAPSFARLWRLCSRRSRWSCSLPPGGLCCCA